MKLSIVIPAYNEEDRLGPMLERYAGYFVGKYGDEVELIVAVNGSSDSTPELAETYASRWPQVRTLVEPRKIGKGGAILMGFREGQGDLLGFVDADGSTPPEAFQDLVEHIGDAGAIIATRWHPRSDVSPRQPLSRRFASRVFNQTVRWMFGLPISDTQCGAKLVEAKALKEILPSIGVTRWAFDVDLLFQLKRAGYPVIERPTIWHDTAGSKVQVVRASLEMFVALVRLRLLYSPFRWVVKVYDRTLGRVVRVR